MLHQEATPPIPKTFSSIEQSKKSDLTTQQVQGEKLGVQGEIKIKAIPLYENNYKSAITQVTRKENKGVQVECKVNLH